MKVLPLPGSLSTPTVPPCRSTSSATRASPMPEPSKLRERAPEMRENRSNSCALSSGAMPMPVSATQRSAPSPSGSGPTLTEIDPSKVSFSALESRFSTTFAHIS